MAYESGSWPPLAVSALIGVIIMNIAASILLKFDASSSMASHRIFGLFGWSLIGGMACYAIALVLYAWSLRTIDLHVAQIVVSLQFAGIILASALLFRETIGLHQWLGILLIFSGLMIAMKP